MKSKIPDLFLQIPPEIRKFLFRALFLFIAWQLVYTFILFDNRILDAPLTNHVANSTAFVLNSISSNKTIQGLPVVDTILFEGHTEIMKASEIKKGNIILLYIADGCNGLELIVVYLGFIICFPKTILNKLFYGLVGILIIDLVNILRCSLLGIVKEKYNDYFNFSHHYLFNAVIYLIILFLWIAFSKSRKIKIFDEYKK